MAFREIRNAERKSMSAVESAAHYVRQMVEIEGKGWGDSHNALRRIGHRYSLLPNTLEHLRAGRAKTLSADLYLRIRGAYLDLCERQIARLQQQLQTERVVGTDDDLEGIAVEAARLAARVAAKKAGRDVDEPGERLRKHISRIAPPHFK